MEQHAFFLPTLSGQRFCLHHPPPRAGCEAIRGQVVYIHPFAEEMNKSRRMAAQQARALATAGFEVLQIDLLGCGDSSGDFVDATWSAWVSDIVTACHWLQSQGTANILQGRPPKPLWLWGLRVGCLLAVDAARVLGQPCNFAFWAPVPSGKLQLQQFLRLKAAGGMASGNAKAILAHSRTELADGRSVEVAGYLLGAQLASGLESAMLTPPAEIPAGRVEWFELSTRTDATLSPSTQEAVSEWQRAGHAVGSHAVTGPAFWQTTEIEEAPRLLTLTTAALSGTVTS